MEAPSYIKLVFKLFERQAFFELSFETQSSHQKIQCSKNEVV